MYTCTHPPVCICMYASMHAHAHMLICALLEIQQMGCMLIAEELRGLANQPHSDLLVSTASTGLHVIPKDFTYLRLADICYIYTHFTLRSYMCVYTLKELWSERSKQKVLDLILPYRTVYTTTML